MIFNCDCKNAIDWNFERWPWLTTGISVIEFRFIDALKNFKMAKCIIWSFVWHHLLICIGVYRRIWISLFFLCIRKSISGIFLLENKNDIQVSQLVSHKSRYSISNKASTAFNFNILGIPFSLNSWRKVWRAEKIAPFAAQYLFIQLFYGCCCIHGFLDSVLCCAIFIRVYSSQIFSLLSQGNCAGMYFFLLSSALRWMYRSWF